MSTQTPRQKQDAAAALKRARSTLLGRPTRRGSFPGTLPGPFIFFRAGSDLQASIPVGVEGLEQGLTKATAELVYLGLTSPGHTVVVPDRTELKLIARLIAKEGTDVHARAWSAINSTSNPYTLRTLTSALSYSWWAPEHVDTEDIEDWAEAFGITSPDRHSMLQQLADKASTLGKRFAHLEDTPSEVRSLVSREAHLLNGSKYNGLAADCRLHTDIEKVTDQQQDLALADPGLLSHHEVDGQVTRLVDATDIGNSRVRFRAVSPFRSKAGRKALITDGETTLPSSENGIISTSFRDGSLFVVVEMRPRDMNWVTLTQKSGRAFFMRDKPFNGFSKKVDSTDRWQKPRETPVPIQGRELPLDVILAGAPS